MKRAEYAEAGGKQPDRSILTKLPKIEVHRHLEGTYPIDSLFRLALKNELDVPKNIEDFKKAFQFPKDHAPDFLLFLSKFKKFWYKTLGDIESITYDSVKSFAKEKLHYMELRFNPLHFTEQTKLDYKAVTKTIISAADAAAAEINLKIRYLLTFNRGMQTAEEMLEIYRKFHEIDLSGVVGIDLAGDELTYPPEQFSSFFDVVKKEGRYGIDIHAGEVSDSQNMWISIEKLHADRIGHGVAAHKDIEIQKVLRDRNIFLAQCITSNRQTGAWQDEATHPMKSLTEAGVPVTIASDDPTIQDSDLVDDYEKTAINFGWTVDYLIELNLKSVQACFLSKQEKLELTEKYKQAVKAFRQRIDPL
ncbi:Adenosine deaminase [Olavius algarvensis spirochete endosymbiont]|uniref:adenosine deaminase n=1 Tax=Olavius algarvensis spirochete endosymbiont TaxID=260710 RepID=UPI000F1559F1|nr:adenosine deaminase [Olavius algarvensis spirochete endosymbiont]CAD7844401.1 MAG: Adenosine deaminase (EC 3.5.4.4) [Olavius algarvensis spirochete endosymbiont]VDA99644.1 Adenosine deaminase [Olavius algarvensis spirochete endosymbiont]